METTRLGRSDLEVSRVGLGCNNFGGRIDRRATREVLDAALEAGVTFLDTADIYGGSKSEQFIGEVLAGRRDRIVLATKFGQDETVPGPGGSREHLRRAHELSLERLRTDVIDLYYYHRPDGETPLEETLGSMQELVDEGSVRSLGLSNVSAAQLESAVATGIVVAAVQNRYSLLHRHDDADVLPLCRAHEIGYIPYFPLESGLLTGKYRRGEPSPAGARLTERDERLSADAFSRVEALESLAEREGRTVLELAIGGLASVPGIASVIAGATSAEQVRSNADAGTWHASAEQLDAIAEVAG